MSSLHFIRFQNVLPCFLNCCPVMSVSPRSSSPLSKGSGCGLAAVLYMRGSNSPFWSPLWGTDVAGEKWDPPCEEARYVMALPSPKSCLPGPTPTFLCFCVGPVPPLSIIRTSPALTPTAGSQVLFFFRDSDRALEVSAAAGYRMIRDSCRLFRTLVLCECNPKLLNWSMNSSQCRRWCSGSHVSSLLP